MNIFQRFFPNADDDKKRSDDKKKRSEGDKTPELSQSPPTQSAVVRRISLVEELRGKLSSECQQHGHAVARQSGRRTPDQAVLKALEQLAESKARVLAESISLNAQNNLLRRLKEEETLREQRVVDRDAQANRYNMVLKALALTPLPGARPALSPWIVGTVTVWLAVSLLPTCHDLLSGLPGHTPWIVGGTAALGISIAIVQGILPSSQTGLGVPVKTVRHSGAMFAGVLLGIAFFGLRLASVRNYGHLLLAVALAFMELGAVVLTERKAKPLSAEIDAYRERVHARALAEACVVAEKQQLDGREALVEAADRTIAAIEDGLERGHAVGDVTVLNDIAVKAMRAGYLQGIAENAAALGGAA